MVKENNKMVLLFLIIAFVSVINIAGAYAWTGNNYYEHHESSPIGLYHYYTIQIQGSYNDGGYHYARGWVNVSGGEDGDVTISTSYALGPDDGTIRGRYNVQYKDYWDFSHGNDPVTDSGPLAEKVPHGSIYWPVSIDESQTK